MRSKWDELYIAGKWRQGKSGATLIDINPFNNERLTEMKFADLSDIDEAYKAAEAAQPSWERTSPDSKRALMERVAGLIAQRQDEIIDLLARESGSARLKAGVEVGASIHFLKEAASFPYRMAGYIFPSDTPGKENFVYRIPKGVVSVIGPWNFPFLLAMRSVAPALATGNAVVLKPSSDTPITGGLLLADLFQEAGLPDGLLNVVVGRGSEIGDAFVSHPIPRMVSFTGSTEVGREVATLAGKYLKQVVLELGGNNAFIVLDDADVEYAAQAAAFGKFLHQGQICMAINQMIVMENVHDKFVECLKSIASRIKVGDPRDPGTQIGPIINQSQLVHVVNCMNETIEAGATLEAGGNVVGNCVMPTVLTNVTEKMPIFNTEVFGPVAAVIKVKSEEEAIRVANASQYGLSGSVHSGSEPRAIRVAKAIRTGMIHVNDQTINDEAHIAFGGEKDSGIGRFGGTWALESFTTVKWLSVQHDRRKFPFS